MKWTHSRLLWKWIFSKNVRCQLFTVSDATIYVLYRTQTQTHAACRSLYPARFLLALFLNAHAPGKCVAKKVRLYCHRPNEIRFSNVTAAVGERRQTRKTEKGSHYVRKSKYCIPAGNGPAVIMMISYTRTLVAQCIRLGHIHTHTHVHKHTHEYQKEASVP